MAKYRYSLEKYSSKKQKVTCPNCGAKRKFVRYIDNVTGEILNENVGRCERVNHCGYHYKPREYFEQNGIKPSYRKLNPQPLIPTYYYDFSVVKDSMIANTQTNLYRYLTNYFEINQVKKTFNKYYVGHSSKFYNSIIYWQVDLSQKVRSGKYMVYDPNTGKRDKNKFYWSKIPKNFERDQCLFGLHLLSNTTYKDHLIGIVESEKTALICDLFFDEKILWLASGGMRNLNLKKFKPLENRTVILFPDLTNSNAVKSSFYYWMEFGIKVKNQLNIDLKINDYLERICNEEQKNQQLDLADFIMEKMEKENAYEFGV